VALLSRHTREPAREAHVIGDADMRIERVRLEDHGETARVGRHVIDAEPSIKTSSRNAL